MSATGIESKLFSLWVYEVELFGMTVIRALSVFAIRVHSFITLRNSNDKSRSNWGSHYGARKPFQTCVYLFVLSRVQVQMAIMHDVDK